MKKTKIIKSNYQPHSSIYLLLFLCRHLTILASQYLALHLYFPPKQTKAKPLVTAPTSHQSPATWPFSAHQSVWSDANSSPSVWGDFKIIRVREKIKRRWYTRSKVKIIWTELASVSKECSHLPGEVGTLRYGPFIQARSLSAGPILGLSLSYPHPVENEHSMFLGCHTDPLWGTSHNVLSGSDEGTVASIQRIWKYCGRITSS